MSSVREHPAGDANLPDGTCRIVSVGGREVGIFNICGTYYGLANTCPHQQGPLCEGEVSGTLTCEGSDDTLRSAPEPTWSHDGEVVACPWHGLEVQIPTGNVFAWPHRRVRTYAVQVTPDGLVISV